MKKFLVRVKGVAPLLMHKFSVSASAGLSATVKKRKSGPPDPAVEAEESAYRLDLVEKGGKGQLCLPAEHFLQSMIAVSGMFQIQGQGKKSYRDNIKGNILVEPDFIGLSNGQGKLYDYKIDVRPVRIKAARINRARPLLSDGWIAEFTIIVSDPNAVPTEVLNAILVSAGQTKGVGDYRPRFGRFMVEIFEEKK